MKKILTTIMFILFASMASAGPERIEIIKVEIYENEYVYLVEWVNKYSSFYLYYDHTFERYGWTTAQNRFSVMWTGFKTEELAKAAYGEHSRDNPNEKIRWIFMNREVVETIILEENRPPDPQLLE